MFDTVIGIQNTPLLSVVGSMHNLKSRHNASCVCRNEKVMAHGVQVKRGINDPRFVPSVWR